ncbi:hypothetical protein B0H65DRAFT_136126 [Neurospora tetraspora]|uniref:Uncharacterized protein n=1 Tax=Neurospora tetraspora TaxID=94610 RepID=A0AAE0JLW4_9PEZI|nr:hypothetical protein B0H65DRAFT_136126 [Neurospora tetraspora]
MASPASVSKVSSSIVVARGSTNETDWTVNYGLSYLEPNPETAPGHAIDSKRGYKDVSTNSASVSVSTRRSPSYHGTDPHRRRNSGRTGDILSFALRPSARVAKFKLEQQRLEKTSRFRNCRHALQPHAVRKTKTTSLQADSSLAKFTDFSESFSPCSWRAGRLSRFASFRPVKKRGRIRCFCAIRNAPRMKSTRAFTMAKSWCPSQHVCLGRAGVDLEKLGKGNASSVIDHSFIAIPLAEKKDCAKKKICWSVGRKMGTFDSVRFLSEKLSRTSNGMNRINGRRRETHPMTMGDVATSSDE